MSDEQSKTESYLNTKDKLLFGPLGPGEMLKLESDVKTLSFLSSFEAYNTCRYRDMCLRYMGEEPARWMDISTTPCPCSIQFFREVEAYSQVIHDEQQLGKLPYTHRQIVNFMTEQRPKFKRAKKVRQIAVTQRRLNET